MYAQVEKTKQNKNRAIANSVVQKKSNEKHGFGFVDNRPESKASNNLQLMINNSSRRAMPYKGLSKEEVHQSANEISSKSYNYGGKIPGRNYKENDLIGGRTLGEFAGDVGRPVGTALGNVVGSIAGAVTGVNISSNSMVGPTWNNHGNFDWGVLFNITGGQAGWIVQEITNTYRANDSLGGAVAVLHTPHYWEAWAVDNAGNIDPNFVDARGCDDWVRPAVFSPAGNNTEGHWSMEGKVYFTSTNPAGLAPGGIPDAGGLLAGANAPADIGVARLHRYAQGTWDSTGLLPTHTGSAS